MQAIVTERLSHTYGKRRALDNVDLAVEKGEVFGLLGPNGGGKTTLFRILSTLMPSAEGRSAILGCDCATQAHAVRRSIGVVFQSPSLDGKLTVWENLRHQGHLYGWTGARLEKRAMEMLERVGMLERRRDRTEELSGGQRRRVELAKGMLHEPRVLLLDEPSTGLDPGGRRDLWTYLEGIRSQDGVTILVTTHLMREADGCDRIGILDHGRLVAIGSPDRLKNEIGGDVITLATDSPGRLAQGIRERFDLDPDVLEDGVRLECDRGPAFLPDLIEAFSDSIAAATLGKPTLEEVFVHHTGHRFWSETE